MSGVQDNYYNVTTEPSTYISQTRQPASIPYSSTEGGFATVIKTERMPQKVCTFVLRAGPTLERLCVMCRCIYYSNRFGAQVLCQNHRIAEPMTHICLGKAHHEQGFVSASGPPGRREYIVRDRRTPSPQQKQQWHNKQACFLFV